MPESPPRGRKTSAETLAIRLLAKYDNRSGRYVRSGDVSRDVLLALYHPVVFDQRLNPTERVHFRELQDMLSPQLSLFD